LITTSAIFLRRDEERQPIPLLNGAPECFSGAVCYKDIAPYGARASWEFDRKFLYSALRRMDVEFEMVHSFEKVHSVITLNG
jgi:hypothetical protein